MNLEIQPGNERTPRLLAADPIQEGKEMMEKLLYVEYQKAIQAFVDAEIAAGATAGEIEKFHEAEVLFMSGNKAGLSDFPKSRTEGIERENLDLFANRVRYANGLKNWHLFSDAYFQDALEARGAYKNESDSA